MEPRPITTRCVTACERPRYLRQSMRRSLTKEVEATVFIVMSSSSPHRSLPSCQLCEPSRHGKLRTTICTRVYIVPSKPHTSITSTGSCRAKRYESVIDESGTAPPHATPCDVRAIYSLTCCKLRSGTRKLIFMYIRSSISDPHLCKRSSCTARGIHCPQAFCASYVQMLMRCRAQLPPFLGVAIASRSCRKVGFECLLQEFTDALWACETNSLSKRSRKSFVDGDVAS